MNSKFILILALILACGYTLRLSTTAPSHMADDGVTGAYQDKDPANLGSDLMDIDGFLKQKFPNLNNFKMTKAETQVVEGINYRYTYSQENSNVSYQFTVWDRPWLNSRKVTLIQKTVTTKDDQGNESKATTPFTPATEDDDQWTDKIEGLFN